MKSVLLRLLKRHAARRSSNAAADTGALLAYLDTRDDVAGLKVGAVGFRVGGG